MAEIPRLYHVGLFSPTLFFVCVCVFGGGLFILFGISFFLPFSSLTFSLALGRNILDIYRW